MPMTRSSVLGAKLTAKDVDAARTLLRFHYDMKTMAVASKPSRTEHMMSLRGGKASPMRPSRSCATYTPGMYAEDN